MVNKRKIHGDTRHVDILQELTIDCEKCCGICCTALYFAKMEGFPQDKAAGTPCSNLQPDFRCQIHKDLLNNKLKGCIAYDCLGAGQKVIQQIYHGRDWSEYPELKEQMFAVYLRVLQMHQMVSCLLEVQTLDLAIDLHEAAERLIIENQAVTHKEAEEILSFHINEYRENVNHLLRETGTIMKRKFGTKSMTRKTYIGKKFVNKEIQGMDFSMCLLIKADFAGCNLYGVNFLGADVRDANVKHADLRDSIFLTQIQINSMIGDEETRLPIHLKVPSGWGL